MAVVAILQKCSAVQMEWHHGNIEGQREISPSETDNPKSLRYAGNALGVYLFLFHKIPLFGDRHIC